MDFLSLHVKCKYTQKVRPHFHQKEKQIFMFSENKLKNAYRFVSQQFTATKSQLTFNSLQKFIEI